MPIVGLLKEESGRPKRVANPKKPFKKYRYLKKRRNPKRDNACFVCKQEGHYARKCPKNAPSKLKACVDIEDFVDNWSVVDSQDEVSDVYILTDASLSENEEEFELSQKMNICDDCSDSDFFKENHYSEEESSEEDTEETYDISSEDVSIEEDASSDSSQTEQNSTSVLDSLQPQPIVNSFCPYPKNVASSSLSMSKRAVVPPEENAFLKKIVKSNNLLYIPVEVQVRNEWITVDAFIDTGGSNNLARPSLFKGLWKPLQNILVSETIGGSVNLTHYVDNVSMRLGGSIIKISAIQHYDNSASLFLGMPFINSVLPVTISSDKIICNIKKKAIAVPRLTLADSEARKQNRQKKVGQQKS